MAFVVARPGESGGRGRRRYEIRESVSTPAGPRAHTLATFRVLTDEVLATAAGRARRSFDAEQIRARAAELGAPVRSSTAAATATALLVQLRNGESLPGALVHELRRALPRRHARSTIPDSLESAVAWIGVDDAARGRALRDLLDVADRIPKPARPHELAFPRMSSTEGS
jgi:hypothetical protein